MTSFGHFICENDVNVPSKSNKRKLQDPDSHPNSDPDPLVRGMDPRIRINTKMSGIRNADFDDSVCMLLHKNLFYDLFCVPSKFYMINVMLLKLKGGISFAIKKIFVNIGIYEKAERFRIVWFYHINFFNRP